MLNKMIITSIEDIFTVDSPKGRHFHVANRCSYGITFCYGGQITYFHKGNAVISDRNHMILLPKGESYFLHGDSSGLFPVINVQCAQTFYLQAPTAFLITRPDVYLKQYERLKELFILGKNSAKCLSILYDILGGIISENQGGNRICAHAVSYIEQNYANPELNNAVIAAELNISEVYLRRLFRETFSVTPKQYILDLRNRKAKLLLSEDRYPIHVIAELCGYSSVYYFSRAFRNSTGLSPTEYRNAEKKVII